MRTSRPPSTRIAIPAAASGAESGGLPSSVAPAKSTVTLSPLITMTADSGEAGAGMR